MATGTREKGGRQWGQLAPQLEAGGGGATPSTFVKTGDMMMKARALQLV